MREQKRILIVEDDVDMQSIYKMFFAQHADKYKIDIENGVRGGLKKIGEAEYDLVILDIIMKPESGDCFYSAVEKNKQYRNLPILIVSIMDEDLLRLLKIIKPAKPRKLGNNVNTDFLQKPITKEQLFRKMDELIR